MTGREPGLRVSRIALMALIAIMPVFGPGTDTVMLMFAAALTAYDGLNRSTLYGIVGALVVAELLFGMDVGVLSVSYATAAVVFIVLARVITLAPWSSASGWRVSDALKALLLACVYFALCSALMVLIGRALYGYGDTIMRLGSLFTIHIRILVPLGLASLLVILRRIDVPFRRPITFGI